MSNLSPTSFPAGPRQHRWGLPVIVFLILTFALTWGTDVVWMLLRTSSDAPDLLTQYLLAAVGPSIAGLVAAAVFGGRAGLGRLLRRFLRWRVGLRWYVLVLVVVPTVLVAAAAVAFAAAGQPFHSTIPWWAAPLVLLLTVFAGPLEEELGWRGFALPELLTRWGWLTSSVLLGLI